VIDTIINVKKMAPCGNKDLPEYNIIEVTTPREIQEVAKILTKPILKYKDKSYVVDNFVAYFVRE